MKGVEQDTLRVWREACELLSFQITAGLRFERLAARKIGALKEHAQDGRGVERPPGVFLLNWWRASAPFALGRSWAAGRLLLGGFAAFFHGQGGDGLGAGFG